MKPDLSVGLYRSAAIHFWQYSIRSLEYWGFEVECQFVFGQKHFHIHTSFRQSRQSLHARCQEYRPQYTTVRNTAVFSDALSHKNISRYNTLERFQKFTRGIASFLIINVMCILYLTFKVIRSSRKNKRKTTAQVVQNMFERIHSRHVKASIRFFNSNDAAIKYNMGTIGIYKVSTKCKYPISILCFRYFVHL